MNTKMMISTIVLGATISAFAVVSVENVTCRQRYPWNGMVDIDYEIVSDNPDATFFVYPKGEDRRRGRPIVMRTLSGDGATNAVGVGKHRMIWDATADMPAFHTSDFAVTLQTISSGAQYLVIDLSDGTNAVTYPVRYSTTPPDISTDTCRTTELWLRLILPGSFMMGSPESEAFRGTDEKRHPVRLTRPYYIGVFELTQKQWMLISGTGNAIKYVGDCRPVDAVSYDMIRGASLGRKWPTANAVDAGSFIGILRSKTSLRFDLPTEAQWEYACRAGTTTSWNSGAEGRYYTDALHDSNCGNTELSVLGRSEITRNDGHDSYGEHTKVGLYRLNAWGLYDMHGNVLEWCLDGYKSVMASQEEIDPVGADSTGKRVCRGGGYSDYARYCRSAARSSMAPNQTNSGKLGFRLVCLPVE